MSLKAFHIVFVLVSTALMALFAVWAFREYATSKGTLELALGIIASISILVLLVYGKWFLRKIKDRGLA